LPIEQQVVVVFAATKGYLDKIKVSDILDFEAGLLKEVDSGLLKTIKDEKSISDKTQASLVSLCESYTSNFIATRSAE